MGIAPSLDAHAFVLDGGVVTQLSAIPGGITSAGFAINNLGDVAGRGRFVDPFTGETVWRGFACINGTMIRLDPLPGFSHSAALAI